MSAPGVEEGAGTATDEHYYEVAKRAHQAGWVVVGDGLDVLCAACSSSRESPGETSVLQDPSNSLVVGILRVASVALGLLLLAMAVEGLFWPEIVYSAWTQRPPRSVTLITGIGWLGYAVLLILAPRWLARCRWLYVIALAATLGLAARWTLGLDSLSDLVAMPWLIILLLPAVGVVMVVEKRS